MSEPQHAEPEVVSPDDASNAPAVASDTPSKPEPTTLSDGSVVDVVQDAKRVAYSEDPVSNPPKETLIPHAVTVEAPDGNHTTIETEDANESAFFHKLIVTLDKLGFRRA